MPGEGKEVTLADQPLIFLVTGAVLISWTLSWRFIHYPKTGITPK
jgi:hypothetical protein